MKFIRKRPVISAMIAIAGLLITMHLLFPLPNPYKDKGFARVVLDSGGRPLRYFPDERGEWRYHVRIAAVSPKYLEALIGYEDRYFYYHPGVNPFSMLRALFQYIRHGRIISGGSTITMQVARIIEPHERTLFGKAKQVFRALQLELKYSKDEILEIYLNLAPFGGSIQGVQAASYTYFDRDISEVNYSEAALLAVLPQAPSRLRPDRHSEAATQAKNKVAERMLSYGYWDKDTVGDILSEPIYLFTNPRPMLAPLLAERLIAEYPDEAVIETYIDRDIQNFLEMTVRREVYAMPEGSSAAVLIMQNSTGNVVGYAGSAEYGNMERFGYIDMVQAVRSPGSALKPFIYAMALDKGLIHSQSLLIDAPRIYSDYQAANFYQTFSGPVAAEDALQRSLNVPAVQLLDHVSPEYFYTAILNTGVQFPILGDKPNLSIALGGGGIRLDHLAMLYTSLANGGLVLQPRFAALDIEKASRQLFSAEAAFITYEMLRRQYRNDHIFHRYYTGRANRLAWKTGTSYGFRDALAVGVTHDYTIAVWVGRPDNVPVAGQQGSVTASPLLFAISDYVERDTEAEIARPYNVEDVNVCWPSGQNALNVSANDCTVNRAALTIEGVTPSTLPETSDSFNQPYIATWLENKAGKRVDMSCVADGEVITKTRHVWPRLVEPFIQAKYKRSSIIPQWDASCKRDGILYTGGIIITGITDSSTIMAATADELPEINISAAGAKGRISWYLNGKFIGYTYSTEVKSYRIEEKGQYQLTGIDDDLQIAVVEFYVD